MAASLPTFTLTVRAASTTVLKIIDSPVRSVDAGAFYNYRPTVRAPAGSKLVFSISNKPSWATFNTTNGALSGTPSMANIATFPNIIIKVTDGKTKASTATFQIAVYRPASGSATLSWVKPTRNTDGSPLLTLSGYRIHYGTSLSSLTKQFSVSSPSITSASIEGLSRGTWYFAVVAYTTAGIESAMSSAAAKTIN